LFTNSFNGEEKKNIPMPKEVTLGFLTKKVAQLRKVCKIKNRFQIKLRRKKIQIEFSGLRWNLESWVLITHKWQ
jgi:hypothetical protein